MYKTTLMTQSQMFWLFCKSQIAGRITDRMEYPGKILVIYKDIGKTTYTEHIIIYNRTYPTFCC